MDGALPVRPNPNSRVVNLRDTASARLVTEPVTGKRGPLRVGDGDGDQHTAAAQVLLTARCRTNLLIESGLQKGSRGDRLFFFNVMHFAWMR